MNKEIIRTKSKRTQSYTRRGGVLQYAYCVYRYIDTYTMYIYNNVPFFLCSFFMLATPLTGGTCMYICMYMYVCMCIYIYANMCVCLHTSNAHAYK